MTKKQTLEAVARYVVLSENTNNLSGLIKGEHHFLIGGESASEETYEPYRLRHGWAVDILAERMEKENAFAWFVDGSPDQANNPNIFRLVPFNKNGLKALPYYSRELDFDDLLGMEFSETEKGLFIAVPKTKKRGYIDTLRTESGFKTYAEQVDLKDGRLHQKAVLSRIEKLFDNRDF